MSERRVIIDGVDFRKLMIWMSIPQTVDEQVYSKWKEEQESKIIEPRREIYLRGADFQGYWKCPRRLWFTVHRPKQQKSMINKSIFTCEVRHDMIEDYLQKRGWQTEVERRKILKIGKFLVPCEGHIDGLSPSNIILDIKHKQIPTDGDMLQTGFYQLLMRPETTNIVLLYPTQIKYLTRLDDMIKKYLPRVFGVVAFDAIMPPKHPDFPRCYRNCEYYSECGRERVPPKRSPDEWTNWLKQIQGLN